MDRAVRGEPVGLLGLVVLEQQRAVGAPERALGELEARGPGTSTSPASTRSESPASLRIRAIDLVPSVPGRRDRVADATVISVPRHRTWFTIIEAWRRVAGNGGRLGPPASPVVPRSSSRPPLRNACDRRAGSRAAAAPAAMPSEQSVHASLSVGAPPMSSESESPDAAEGQDVLPVRQRRRDEGEPRLRDRHVPAGLQARAR